MKNIEKLTITEVKKLIQETKNESLKIRLRNWLEFLKQEQDLSTALKELKRMNIRNKEVSMEDIQKQTLTIKQNMDRIKKQKSKIANNIQIEMTSILELMENETIRRNIIKSVIGFVGRWGQGNIIYYLADVIEAKEEKDNDALIIYYYNTNQDEIFILSFELRKLWKEIYFENKNIELAIMRSYTLVGEEKASIRFQGHWSKMKTLKMKDKLLAFQELFGKTLMPVPMIWIRKKE